MTVTTTTHTNTPRRAHPAVVRAALRSRKFISFDAAGKLLSVTDPYAAKTTLGYDTANNPTLVTDSENHTQKLDYDLDGRPIKHTDGNITQLIYGDQASGLNRLTQQSHLPDQ